MKTHFLTSLQFLKDIGFDVILILAGMSGGVVMLSNPSDLSWKQKLITVLAGGLTANYLTPLAAELFNLSEKTVYGLAFILGYLGLRGVEMLIIYIQNRFMSKNNQG